MEAVGRMGATAPVQMAEAIVNVGVTSGSTVTDKLTGPAHCPAPGVNVKVAFPAKVVLIVAGVQVPVMPLAETAGSAGALLFWQSGPIWAKVGTITGLTAIFKVVVDAHCPAAGVKVYVPVVVLLTVAGVQVPVIPLLEVVGRMGAVAPVQIACEIVNVGVTIGVTVTVNGTVVAH